VTHHEFGTHTMAMAFVEKTDLNFVGDASAKHHKTQYNFAQKVITPCTSVWAGYGTLRKSLKDGSNVKHPNRKLRIRLTASAREPKTIIKDGQIPEQFSVVPLLLAEGEIPSIVRQALLEGRRQDAAAMLMHQYGLSCAEASDLLDFFACE
jgi:hypothetical protein